MLIGHAPWLDAVAVARGSWIVQFGGFLLRRASCWIRRCSEPHSSKACGVRRALSTAQTCTRLAKVAEESGRLLGRH